MKIGILGAGHIGGNLAQLLVQRGHDVSVANSRGPATLTEVAERTGATAATVQDVPAGADVVIVALPLKAVPLLPKGLLDGAKEGAAVIDTMNYYPQRDGQIAPIDDGETSSRWVRELLGRPVVKVFNNIHFRDLVGWPAPQGTPGRRALPVAGDYLPTKRVVLDLVDEIGFDAVDVGGLDESRRYQPGTPAYGADADAAALITLLNQA